MDFTNFANKLYTMIVATLGSSYTVKLENVQKNNGVELKALVISHGSSNVSPSIYLSSYYDRYTNGTMTITDIVNEIINTYRQNKVSRKVDMRYFLDYKDVKPHLVYKLINAEKNKELLEDIPYIKYMDLAIVFRCMVFHKEIGDASILVRNTHMKLWGVSVEQLYQDAKENTKKLLPYEITTMANVISHIGKKENLEIIDDEFIADIENAVPLYVLSNKSQTEGASCMLYPNLLHDFAEALNNSFYIIPSSIHELLLLPSADSYDNGELKSIIKEINDTQLIPEEVLSDSLYFFDKETDKIVML